MERPFLILNETIISIHSKKKLKNKYDLRHKRKMSMIRKKRIPVCIFLHEHTFLEKLTRKCSNTKLNILGSFFQSYNSFLLPMIQNY